MNCNLVTFSERNTVFPSQVVNSSQLKSVTAGYCQVTAKLLPSTVWKQL